MLDVDINLDKVSEKSSIRKNVSECSFPIWAHLTIRKRKKGFGGSYEHGGKIFLWIASCH
jgi:hypothetical protein